MGYIDRHFRLTNEPGGLGLSCTAAGLFFAGVPLLRKTDAGFAPRPPDEVASLLRPCDGNIDQAALSRSLKAIAAALDRGDLAYAMTAAVLMRLPELDWDGAARLAKADERLAKYDPSEPRDQRGRWTKSPTADLERKYDELGPVEFSDQVIRFSDEIARHGKDLSPQEQKAALREYQFLQQRIAFWRTYEPMPPQAIANITSAALNLFQGAVLGGIVSPTVNYYDLPHSYLVAAAGAPPAADTSGFGGRRPQIDEHFGGEPEPSSEVGEASSGFAGPSSKNRSVNGRQATAEPVILSTDAETAGLGGVVSAEEARINWNRGIEDQGLGVEDYSVVNTPGATLLRPGSKTWDAFVKEANEAISVKTLNSMSYTYAANPRRVYWTVKRYIDAAANYKTGRSSIDLDENEIATKKLYLFVRDGMSEEQKFYLQKAIDYARIKSNSLSIVVTRVTG